MCHSRSSLDQLTLSHTAKYRSKQADEWPNDSDSALLQRTFRLQSLKNRLHSRTCSNPSLPKTNFGPDEMIYKSYLDQATVGQCSIAKHCKSSAAWVPKVQQLPAKYKANCSMLADERAASAAHAARPVQRKLSDEPSGRQQPEHDGRKNKGRSATYTRVKLIAS